jgi:hypothetical protein
MFKDSDIQEVSTKLIEAGTDLHATSVLLTLNKYSVDAFGTSLYFAVVAWNMKLAQALLLIDLSLDLTCTLESPLTPLFLVVYNKYPEFVRFLLDYTKIDEEKRYMFLSLAFLSPEQALRQLIIYGSGWRTAIEATVDELIKAGCDVNFPEESRPLLFTIKYTGLTFGFNLLEVLVQHGTSTGDDNYSLVTTIQSRTNAIKRPIVDLILLRGLIPDLNSLLYIACAKGAAEIVEVLAKSYIDIRTIY